MKVEIELKVTSQHHNLYFKQSMPCYAEHMLNELPTRVELFIAGMKWVLFKALYCVLTRTKQTIIFTIIDKSSIRLPHLEAM